MEANKIKAMRNGGVKIFTQHTWDIAHPETEGWVQVGVVSDSVLVEVDAIPIVMSEIDPVEVVDVSDEKAVPSQSDIDNDLYPTKEEMLEFLNEKLPKPIHQATGIKRIRRLYDENS